MATLKNLADYVRNGCSSNEKMTIPQMTAQISNIINLTLTKGLIDGTVENYVIPSGVTEIRDDAFRGCSSLTSVTIPDSVTEIGNRAFSGCSSLTSVTISDSVTKIGYQAFFGCSSLTSVTIPSGVTEIGTYAFFGCSSLTDIYCGFSAGAVSGAPWGAYNAAIHYNSTGPTA